MCTYFVYNKSSIIRKYLDKLLSLQTTTVDFKKLTAADFQLESNQFSKIIALTVSESYILDQQIFYKTSLLTCKVSLWISGLFFLNFYPPL